jgi:hypothetical protein
MYSPYVVALFTVPCFHPKLTLYNLPGSSFLYLDIDLETIVRILAMKPGFATTDLIEKASKELVD